MRGQQQDEGRKMAQDPKLGSETARDVSRTFSVTISPNKTTTLKQPRHEDFCANQKEPGPKAARICARTSR
ncbi:hypothetical protein B566_EDAN015589 [Ephemera danica]|nr:hypothetical protein B566_EDAN015589 [Ephemera danica]